MGYWRCGCQQILQPHTGKETAFTGLYSLRLAVNLLRAVGTYLVRLRACCAIADGNCEDFEVFRPT